jgi:hypothetical protein
LLYVVYEEGYDRAGWVGWGYDCPKMPRDADMDKRFKSIDNHYLLFYLQYGYFGVIAFTFLAIGVLWNLLPPFLNAAGPVGRLAAGLFGGISGCLLAMRGVWLAPDYGGLWLFSAGLTVCLSQLYRGSRVGGAQNLG